MKPVMSMLKFRVPYHIDLTNGYEYLDGELCFQPWAPPFSGETRLITNGKSTKIYKDYESKLHYFNNIIRSYAKYNDIILKKRF